MNTRVGVNSNCPRCQKPTRSGYCRDCAGSSIWIDYEIQREFTDWADLCDRHNAEVDELRAKLDQVRSEIGCARGQRTTQYCADLERTMKERDELQRRLDALTSIPEEELERLKRWRVVSEEIQAMCEDEKEDTPAEWVVKLKALRGKSCTYGNVSFSECSYCQSELARAVAIAEGRGNG